MCSGGGGVTCLSELCLEESCSLTAVNMIYGLSGNRLKEGVRLQTAAAAVWVFVLLSVKLQEIWSLCPVLLLSYGAE